MKKLTLLIIAAAFMLSCGSKTGKTLNETDSLAVDSVVDAGIDKHSEDYIRQRIDTIYKGVGKSTHDPINRDSVYCSQRYYALMCEAVQLCNEAGEILYDFDHWICGQDWSDDWNCKVEKVYEINLDYLMSLNGHGDVFGIWWDRRNADLRFVLTPWQYDKYVALNHFYRPVAWKAGSWTFAVYAHYNRGHFYNDRPTVFVSYRGGHNRVHGSHYAHMHKPAVHHHAPAVHHPAPAPHHASTPVKVDKRHGLSNHTLANNTPRHGHSRSTSGRLLP